MELKEMIKVMQHYENGGVVQRCNFGSHYYSDITTEDYLFNFCDYKYRIKEPKQKVTIEKWLCRDYHGNFIVIETTGIDAYYYEKVKLIKSYEVEL